MIRNERWFEHLFERHRALLLAYCTRRVGPSNAQDAVSEVFSVAWRRRQDIPAGAAELPWLYGVARNVVSRHWRSAHRTRRIVEKAGSMRQRNEPELETIVVERFEHAAVREALAALRPNDREVLMLSAWEGLSHREIAQAMDCSLAAIDKRLVRAKKRLAAAYRAVDGTRSSLQDGLREWSDAG